MLSKIFAAAAAVVVTGVPVVDITLKEEFVAYCDKYGKSYGPTEFDAHMANYKQKKADIEDPNGVAPYRKGINQFSDLSDEEYKRFFGLSKAMLYDRRLGEGKTNANTHVPSKTLELTEADIPSAFDWTKKHAVTKARQQGTCGSCWAFAGTAAIESALFLATGNLAVLSVQAFVDCVPDPKKCGGTGGCEGATYDLLYQYANSSHGHGPVLDSSYPYTGKDGTCHVGAPVAKVGGWVDVQSNNATALKLAVMQTPVAVGVAAMNWGDYMGGVYPSELCDTDLDHAVLLVGWGVDAGLGPYWKIKNSWGAGWGENGYIRVQRNEHFCSVDKVPGDGLGCAGGPDEVTVCGACAIQFAPSYPVDVTLV